MTTRSLLWPTSLCEMRLAEESTSASLQSVQLQAA